MFMFHIGFSLNLIALALGTMLLLKSHCSTQDSCGSSCMPKWIAYFIIILSLLGVLCGAYWGMKMWKSGQMQMPYHSMMMTAPGSGS